MIALFSGRFDPPHLGHLITLSRLSRDFDKIVIVVLDHHDAEYPISYRVQSMNEAIKCMKGNYEVVVNKIHFGNITRDELNKFKFDVYVSGNLEVLKNIESIGVKTLYVERSFDYSATKIREMC